MQRRHFLRGMLSAPAFVKGLDVAGQPFRGEWVVETTEIMRAFEPVPTGGLRLRSLKNVVTGHEWAMPGYADFAFASDQVQFEGLSPHSGFHLAGQERRTIENGATELRLDFINQEHRLKLSLFYIAFPNTSVIEHRCRLENIGTKTVAGVSRFDPIFFQLHGRAADFQVRAVRRDRYAVESWPINEALTIRGGSWNAPEDAGFVAVENASVQEILFLGIRWERDWVVRLGKQANGVEISAGLIDFSHDLLAGEVLETPRIFLGLAHGDLDAASRKMRDYLWKYVLPPPLKDFPWVVYDIYGTEDVDVEKTVMEEIDVAANLGVENFYFDASWYAGASRRGTGDWGAGLGRYREDGKKFPRGLGYISSYAHSKGLKFGLWVDPVVVDRRLIPNEIPPEWVGQKDGKDIEIQIAGWEAPLVQLCLGNPKVVEHLKSNLSRIVDDFRLDWLKWDNSGLHNQVCNRDDHGHQKGDGSYAGMRGEYAVWDYLHKHHPDLVLEECGYPSRQDFGLAPYCRVHWLSDETAPSRSVRVNVLSASYLFPSSYNSSCVVHDPEAMGEKDPALLDTVYRSRMMGTFGFGAGNLLTDRVSQFPQEVLAAAQRNIPVYKSYRHLLADDCYHLTPPSGSPEGWQAVEFCKRDGSEAVVLAFRNSSTQSLYRFGLRGLQRTARYRVKSVNHESATTQSGEELGKEGVFIELPKSDMSEVLLLKRL